MAKRKYKLGWKPSVAQEQKNSTYTALGPLLNRNDVAEVLRLLQLESSVHAGRLVSVKLLQPEERLIWSAAASPAAKRPRLDANQPSSSDDAAAAGTKQQAPAVPETPCPLPCMQSIAMQQEEVPAGITRMWFIRQPLCLDAPHTADYCNESVTYYEQTVQGQSPAGAQIAFSDGRTHVPRSTFFMCFFAFYAIIVLGAPGLQGASWVSPSEQTVLMALDAIDAARATPGFDFHARFLQYAFSAKAGYSLGPYAKDQIASGKIKTLFMDRLPELLDPGAMRLINDCVLLAAMSGAGVSGMTRDLAWMYSGGLGVAGMHVEDGYLDFINVMLLLALDISLLPQLTARVMRLAMELCACKTWVFAPSRHHHLQPYAGHRLWHQGWWRGPALHTAQMLGAYDNAPAGPRILMNANRVESNYGYKKEITLVKPVEKKKFAAAREKMPDINTLQEAREYLATEFNINLDQVVFNRLKELVDGFPHKTVKDMVAAAPQAGASDEEDGAGANGGNGSGAAARAACGTPRTAGTSTGTGTAAARAAGTPRVLLPPPAGGSGPGTAAARVAAGANNGGGSEDLEGVELDDEDADLEAAETELGKIDKKIEELTKKRGSLVQKVAHGRTHKRAKAVIDMMVHEEIAKLSGGSKASK